jgi:arylsulfatase A-like enzyme
MGASRWVGPRRLAALVVFAVGAGCDRQPERRGDDLLLIVVDTLRADHLGCYGYTRDTSPRLDAFARESIVYERCESQATWTLASTATLLTGLHPFRHGLVRTASGPLSPDAVTLAERLHAAGYATLAYSANNVVTHASGFDQGFDRFETGRCVDAGVANDVVKRWVAEASRSPKPFFLYVHYFDPHHPYDDPGGNYARWGGKPGEGVDCPDALNHLIRGEPSGLSEADVASLVAHYDGEIRWADEKIGELLDEYRRLGLLDHTVVVVAADHGEQFLEHGWVRHGSTVFEEETHVPLIVRIPGEAPRRVASRVDLADVAPTVIDLLDLTRDDGLDGVSLARIGRQAHPDDVSFSETQHRFDVANGEVRANEQLAVRRGRWKLVELHDTAQLFDLENDPREAVDVALANPDVVESLRRELHAWKTATTRRSLQPAAMDETLREQLLQRLRANGYLPDVSPAQPPQGPDARPSPTRDEWWPEEAEPRDHD